MHGCERLYIVKNIYFIRPSNYLYINNGRWEENKVFNFK